MDPARFWEITPRLYTSEMAGAAKRAEQARENVWFAAMLPNLKKPPTLEEFVGGKKDHGRAVARCIEAWDKIDAALAANRNRAA